MESFADKRSISEIINDRKIILGPKDRIKSSSLSKYPWAYDTFVKMRDNEWKSSSIDLTKDHPEQLPSGARTAMTRALAFLTNLDGMQLENLTFNIVEHITDYTVQQCIYRQIYEEANHVDSYAIMIETFYRDPREVYLLHETDAVLREKNDFILAQANAINNSKDIVEAFIYAVVSNIILEGVYFHSGFLLFYVFKKLLGLMGGAAENIQYIQRDETSHCYLFRNIFNTLKEEYPTHFTDTVNRNIVKLFEAGVALESKWGGYIVEEGVPGIDAASIEDHIKSLADRQMVGIGFEPIYNVKTPYPWVEEFAEQPNNTEKNFFETKPVAYSKRDLDLSDL